MHPVQEPDRSEVDHRFLMMRIVLLCNAAEKIISTMHGRGFQELIGQKQPEGYDMALQYHRRD